MENISDSKHILLLYRTMIPSIQLCGHSQLEYLASVGKIEYKASQVRKLDAQTLKWCDIVLLGRLDSELEFKITEILHNAGKYLIYIIDDDLLNIPSELSSAEYYSRKQIRNNIQGMIELSNAIISPSFKLLNKYAINGRKAILIDEPAIDSIDYKRHKKNDIVKIGFAGSIDRIDDINNILKDSLIKIKQEYKEQVEFEFFGAIPSFAKSLNATVIPYCNSYDTYRKKINSLDWDIGLAPMPDTAFHSCKHYNKFIEYGAAGIVGVYSKLDPYIRLEQDGRPGIFCSNDSDEWYDAIKYLIDNYEYRESLREECVNVVKRDFTVEHLSMELWEQIKTINIVGVQKSKEFYSDFLLKRLYVCDFIKRCENYAYRHLKNLDAKMLMGKVKKRFQIRLNPESIVSKSELFDAKWYSQTYNIPLADAARHYLNKGYKIGNNPSTKFDSVRYKMLYADIGDMNPLLHYEVYGMYENRKK